MEKDSTIPAHLCKMFKDISFLELDDLIDFIDDSDKQRLTTVHIGDTNLSIYTGEVITYRIEGLAYGGAIIEIFGDDKEMLYLAVKRLGVPGIYDLLILGGASSGGVDIIFDIYSNKMHRSNLESTQYHEVIDIITYGIGSGGEAVREAVQDGIEYHIDMLDALEEFTDPNSDITVH